MSVTKLNKLLLPFGNNVVHIPSMPDYKLTDGEINRLYITFVAY